MPKILIIRLSSIGDIIQCMSTIGGIRRWAPSAEIHWIARSDMAQTLSVDSRINKVWAFDKSLGLKGLLALADQLRAERFDYIYDAHSNLRSNVLKLKLCYRLTHRPRLVVRAKERFHRFLLFKFRINRFKNWPFVGAESFRAPLRKWGITDFEDDFSDWQFPAEFSKKFGDICSGRTVTLVPSANWAMKRWPVSHWRSLVELLSDCNFVILAGPADTFCEEIRDVAPARVVNMAGKCSIMESSYIVSRSKVVVSGDTGFMHSADQFGIPSIALMGPTAFGYPARATSHVMELDMKCRPCTKDGRGECSQLTYQQCLADITPQSVAQQIREIIDDVLP